MKLFFEFIGFLLKNIFGLVGIVLKILAPINLLNSLSFWILYSTLFYYDCPSQEFKITCNESFGIIGNILEFMNAPIVLNLVLRFMLMVGFLLDMFALVYLFNLVDRIGKPKKNKSEDT